MFGITPGTFDNFEAADITSKGYSMEEKVEWTVVKKVVNNNTFYRPCRVTDYDYNVKADGWVIADD
jgi:hypothetical protein